VLACLVAGCAATAASTPTVSPPAPFESPTAQPTSAPEPTPSGEAATVIRVVDGDTIHARVNGTDEKVRIIGMDSPETSKPGTPVECFAKEATAEAKRLLKPSDRIVLQPDPTQDTRDRFGRLLAHVFLADGSLFAQTMIRHGWAVHYVYDGVPSIYADRLAAAEAKARAEKVGLWSPKTCNGNPHEATAKP
jgi:micrococcal nuclease